MTAEKLVDDEEVDVEAARVSSTTISSSVRSSASSSSSSSSSSSRSSPQSSSLSTGENPNSGHHPHAHQAMIIDSESKSIGSNKCNYSSSGSRQIGNNSNHGISAGGNGGRGGGGDSGNEADDGNDTMGDQLIYQQWSSEASSQQAPQSASAVTAAATTNEAVEECQLATTSTTVAGGAGDQSCQLLIKQSGGFSGGGTCDSDFHHSKNKKSRRRRGKGRYKPYKERGIDFDGIVGKKFIRNRERLFSQGKPMAPYNTTSFLLDDQEKRIRRDSEGESIAGQLGIHSPSRDRHGPSASDLGTTSETASNSGEDEQRGDFDFDYDSLNYDRIIRLPREEVAKELVSLERKNDSLLLRVKTLEQEKEGLIRLLRNNDIDFQEALAVGRRWHYSRATLSGSGNEGESQ